MFNYGYLSYNSQIRVFKTYIWKLIYTSFQFSSNVVKWFFINKLKILRPIDKTKLSLSRFNPFFFPPTGPPLCPSLFFFFSFSLSLNKIVFFYSTYQTHNYIFSHFKICYLKYGIKQIFCIMSTLNKCLYNTFQTTIFTLI